MLGYAVQTLALSLPPPSPNEPEVTSIVESCWSRYVKDTQSVYTAVCGLKSQRKHWITTAIQYRKRLGKSRKDWFVNSSSFLQSLVLLMCFAMSIVLSGVACSIYLFSIMPSVLPMIVCCSVLCGPMLLRQSHNNILSSNSIICTSSTRDHCVYEKVNAARTNYCAVTSQTVSVSHSERRTVISMLLLKAGDVELNPGPLKQRQATSEPETDNLPVRGAEPHSAFDAQLALSQTERQSSELVLPYGRFFSTEDNEKSVLNMKEDDQLPLSSEDGPSSGKYVSEIKETHTGIAVSSSAANSTLLFSASGHTQRTVLTPLQKQSCTPSLSVHTKDSKIFLKEAIADWKRKSEQEKKACIEDPDEVLIKLFLYLIRLYFKQQSHDFCPLCLKEDKVKNSHIIPKCLLNGFKHIHVPVTEYTNHQKDDDFLYDFSRTQWTRFSPRKAVYKLLCEQCECNDSVDEKKLKGVYLAVSSNPNTTCQIEGIEYRELHHILAQILFRGVLVNVNIDHSLHGHWFMHEKFKSTFFQLWNYCRNVSIPNPPDLLLFLLPNCAYNDETTYSLFSMERVLRSPHYTELVQDEAGLYFYTKIDCFHIVLPIDDDSLRYFKTFRNGLCTDAEKKTVYMLQSVRPRAHRKGEKPFDEVELTLHFPTVLMEWNMQLYVNYIRTMLEQPQCKIRDYDIPFILFPGEKVRHSDLDIELRKHSHAKLAAEAMSPSDLTDAKKTVLREQDDTKAIKEAGHMSPLRVVMVSQKEYIKLKEVQKKMEDIITNELQQEVSGEIEILLDRIREALVEYKRKQANLHDELAIRRSSEKSLSEELEKERSLQKKQMEDLLKSYENEYKWLAKTFSELESAKYNNCQISLNDWKYKKAKVNEAIYLRDKTEGLDDELHEKFKELVLKFENLTFYRSLSA